MSSEDTPVPNQQSLNGPSSFRREDKESTTRLVRHVDDLAVLLQAYEMAPSVVFYEVTPSLIGGRKSVLIHLGAEFETFSSFTKAFQEWCSEFGHIKVIIDRKTNFAGQILKVEYECINNCPMQVKIVFKSASNKYKITVFCSGYNPETPQITDRTSADFSYKNDTERNIETINSAASNYPENKGLILGFLNIKELKDIIKGEVLSNRHIDYAQKLLSERFPKIKGLVYCLKSYEPTSYLKPHSKSYEPTSYLNYENLVQIIFIHNPLNPIGHWVTITTIDCDPDEIKIYDSDSNKNDSDKGSKKRLEEIIKQIILSRIRRFNYVPCAQQEGNKDCGVFAIYFAFYLCNRFKNFSLPFNQAWMRRNIFSCFNNNCLDVMFDAICNYRQSSQL